MWSFGDVMSYSEACEWAKHAVITVERKKPRVNVKSTKFLRRVKKVKERREALACKIADAFRNYFAG